MSEETPAAPAEGITFDNIGGMPSPEQVGTIWNSMPQASTRKVAEKMTNMGWKISAKTVARYQAAGFVSLPPGKKPKNAEKQGDKRAREKLVEAATRIDQLSAMHASPEMAAVKDVLREARDPNKNLTCSNFDDLMKKGTLELKEQFAKTTMAAGIMLGEAVIARREALSLLPKDVGSFLNDMSQVADNLKLTGDDIVNGDKTPGDGAKVINGTVADSEPTTSSLSARIHQFRKAAEKVPA